MKSGIRSVESQDVREAFPGISHSLNLFLGLNSTSEEYYRTVVRILLGVKFGGYTSLFRENDQWTVRLLRSVSKEFLLHEIKRKGKDSLPSVVITFSGNSFRKERGRSFGGSVGSQETF